MRQVLVDLCDEFGRPWEGRARSGAWSGSDSSRFCLAVVALREWLLGPFSLHTRSEVVLTPSLSTCWFWALSGPAWSGRAVFPLGWGGPRGPAERAGELPQSLRPELRFPPSAAKEQAVCLQMERQETPAGFLVDSVGRPWVPPGAALGGVRAPACLPPAGARSPCPWSGWDGPKSWTRTQPASP